MLVPDWLIWVFQKVLIYRSFSTIAVNAKQDHKAAFQTASQEYRRTSENNFKVKDKADLNMLKIKLGNHQQL